MNIMGCVNCVIYIIFTRVTRCVKSRCVISPLKGGDILHTLHFIHTRVIVLGLHTTQLRTPADTNSAYGLWHPGKESFAHGKHMPIGNVCLWANLTRQIFPRFFPGGVWKQVTMRDEFC
jgi:hypothetical protein